VSELVLVMLMGASNLYLMRTCSVWAAI